MRYAVHVQVHNTTNLLVEVSMLMRGIDAGTSSVENIIVLEIDSNFSIYSIGFTSCSQLSNTVITSIFCFILKTFRKNIYCKFIIPIKIKTNISHHSN